MEDEGFLLRSMVPSREDQSDPGFTKRRGEGKSWLWEPEPHGNHPPEKTGVTYLRGHSRASFMYLPQGMLQCSVCERLRQGTTGDRLAVFSTPSPG